MIDCFLTYHPILHLALFFIVFVGDVTELKFTEVRSVKKFNVLKPK